MAGLLAVIVGLVQFLVGIRFVFLLLGANPGNAFVSWIYDLSTPLVTPFAGILGRSAVVAEGAVVTSVLEWASLLALLVYGIVGSILVRAVSHTAPRYHVR
jgi:YggT family protein